jgi:hypothetical protein
VMRVNGQEGLRIGPVRIENRQHVRDAARAVPIEFLQAAELRDPG